MRLPDTRVPGDRELCRIERYESAIRKRGEPDR